MLLSIISPYIAFGQSRDLRAILERGGALEREEVGILDIVRESENRITEKIKSEKQTDKLAFIRELNASGIPYTIDQNGNIIVNPNSNRRAEISEEKTVVKDKDGKILDRIDSGWRRGVDVLFTYVLPPIIAAGLVKETAKAVFRVGLLRSPALFGWLGFYTTPVTVPAGAIYLKYRAEQQDIKRTEEFRRQSKENYEKERLRTQQERKKEAENYYSNLLRKAIEEQD